MVANITGGRGGVRTTNFMEHGGGYLEAFGRRRDFFFALQRSPWWPRWSDDGGDVDGMPRA